MSLCSATVAGLVGTPGALAESRGVSTVSASQGLTYTVVRNDSLSRIASRVGVRLSDLLSVNGFTASSVIVPGQTIKLPDGAKAPGSAATSTAPPADSRVTKVLDFARAQLGKPYAFGTAGPATYDCSGLTRAAYRQVGVSLPHQSLEQSKLGTAVDWKSEPIRPGDLVFTFSTNNQTQISHVGIAISATQWIEAPNSGNSVRVSNLPSTSRIQAVRRFL